LPQALQEMLMRSTATPWPLSLLLATLSLLAAGCASRESREAGYDRWLSPWQGATEESLRARWGRPVSEEPEGSGKRLVYVYSQPPGSGGSSLGISIGGFGIGGGGHSAVGVGVGGTVPISPSGPQSCTTYFHVEQGKVVSWSFEGAGCAAP
jgi:hypothetical protein